MSGNAEEAETAFNYSGPSRGYTQPSTDLYVQDESVSFPPARTGGASEDAPLLPSSSSNVRRRRRRASIGFISLLVFVCVLAGSVTFVSIILLAVYPESLQGVTLINIYPNDTILAVPDGGLNPGRINYILYKYYEVEESQRNSDMDETDRLLLYKQQCINVRPQSRVIDIDKSFIIPDDDDYVSVVIDHQYLLNGSSINYQIDVTLSSETVPSHCYAKLVLTGEQSNGETVEICNTTSASFPVKVTRDGYAMVLVVLNYPAVRLKAINIKASGTLYYYDVIQSKADLACEIDPPTSTRCSIPIQNNANQNGGSDNVCILAVRESSYTSKSEFEYYTASFAYGQVILITLICVGLVSFVCMCGLSISLCTKPGRRLREALKMSSPLS